MEIFTRKADRQGASFLKHDDVRITSYVARQVGSLGD